MRQDVPELAAFVDGPRRRWTDVARHSEGRRELPEQPPHTFGVLRDLGIHLCPGALEPYVRIRRRPAVARSDEKNGVEAARSDQPVQVCIDEIDPRRRSPVAEQAGFDVLGAQRLAKERIAIQVDLTHGQIVRRAPPRVDGTQLFGIEPVRHAAPPR